MINNNMLSIVSFNVCWEALEAVNKKSKMEHCMKNSENICSKTIGKILAIYSLNTVKKKYKNITCHDFIGIQEVDPYRDQIWNNNLRIELNKHKFFDKYDKVYIKKRTVFRSGCITFYNKFKYKLITKYSFNLALVEVDSRPCLITIFQNNINKNYIIVINCHFPHLRHSKTDLIKVFDRLNNIIHGYSIIFNTNDVIIMGDFNIDLQDNINNYLKIIKSNKIKFYDDRHNYKIKTCCNSFGNPNGIFKYGWYDNIFTTIGSCEYYTYGNEVVDYSSDHKPIYAIIKI
jgi:endonuclease/exonuclease/phosphatase family metal-dependent hydrolase